MAASWAEFSLERPRKNCRLEIRLGHDELGRVTVEARDPDSGRGLPGVAEDAAPKMDQLWEQAELVKSVRVAERSRSECLDPGLDSQAPKTLRRTTDLPRPHGDRRAVRRLDVVRLAELRCAGCPPSCYDNLLEDRLVGAIVRRRQGLLAQPRRHRHRQRQIVVLALPP